MDLDQHENWEIIFSYVMGKENRRRAVEIGKGSLGIHITAS